MKILPDTNFLIYLARFKLLDELEKFQKVLIIKPVLKELVMLSKSDGKRKEKPEDIMACKIVLMFFNQIKDQLEYINEDVEGRADDELIKISREKDALVGTMDKELLKRLKEKKLRVVIIRQQKFLEVQ
jgi:rRNA-processing protein FCF1